MGEFHQAVRKICIEYEPDLIIVETTGVADPRSIIAEIPDLETFVRFDSIVCVVDVPNLEYILRDYPVALSQIECANLILLNKKELMDDETLVKVEKIIGSINPHATILRTTYARVNPGLFFAMEEDIGVRVMKEDRTSLECTDLDAQQVRTFTLRLPGDLKESSFMRFLDGLPDSVYRLKGVIKIKGRKQPQLLQYVVHRYEISNFLEKSMEPNALVFIGRNLDENALKQDFARCLAEE
jgi:G3E family GTPase